MSAVKILVTTDGSNLSDKAVDTAIELAEQVGGSVVGMTVVLSAAPAGGFTEEEPIVKAPAFQQPCARSPQDVP